MTDPERFKLLHGPYSAPALRRGDRVECEYRGECVTVGGLTDAPIPWPRLLKNGRPALIVCGDLTRAIRSESVLAVAHHWGVSPTTVWKWRTAMGIDQFNDGTRRLHRDYQPEKFTPLAYEKMKRTNRTEDVRAKIATAKRGRPAHPNIRRGLLRAARRQKSIAHRKAIALALRLRCEHLGVRPPGRPDDRPWEPREDRLLGMTLDRIVASLLGRTTAAVRQRRRSLGIPMSRHSRLRQARKPTGYS